MNWPLDENKILVLWQVPVLLAGLAMLFWLGPRLIGRSCRKRGLPVPSLLSRWGLSLLVFFAATIGVIFSIFLFGEGLKFSDFGMAIAIPASGLVVLEVVVWAFLRKHPLKLQLAYGLTMAIATLAIVACFMASLHRTRELHIRSRDAMHLNCVAKGLLLYGTEDPQTNYPPDLRILVDTMNLPPSYLVPSIGGSKEKYPPDKPYTGPCDYKYIPQAADHADLVWAWLPAEFYDGEVGLVLFGDGSTNFLRPHELTAAIRRTQEWVAAHPATRPASAPAAAPASQATMQPIADWD